MAIINIPGQVVDDLLDFLQEHTETPQHAVLALIAAFKRFSEINGVTDAEAAAQFLDIFKNLEKTEKEEKCQPQKPN